MTAGLVWQLDTPRTIAIALLEAAAGSLALARRADTPTARRACAAAGCVRDPALWAVFAADWGIA